MMLCFVNEPLELGSINFNGGSNPEVKQICTLTTDTTFGLKGTYWCTHAPVHVCMNVLMND